MSQVEFARSLRRIPDDELKKMTANAWATHCDALGHTKVDNNELRERGVAPNVDEEALYNGSGSI